MKRQYRVEGESKPFRLQAIGYGVNGKEQLRKQARMVRNSGTHYVRIIPISKDPNLKSPRWGAYVYPRSAEKRSQRYTDGNAFLGNSREAIRIDPQEKTYGGGYLRSSQDFRASGNPLTFESGVRIYNQKKLAGKKQSKRKRSTPKSSETTGLRPNDDASISCSKCGNSPPYWTDTRLKQCAKCSREGRPMTQQELSDAKEIYEAFPGSIRHYHSKKPPEITGIRRNVMGTTSFSLKGGRMRKSQNFTIYPKNADDGLPPHVFIIQSSSRIGLLDMKQGRVIATPPQSGYTSFALLSFYIDQKGMQNLGTMEKEDYRALFDAIGATSQDWDSEPSLIKTNNEGAGQDFFNAVKGDELA